MDMKWYLIVVSVCISLVISQVENIFLYFTGNLCIFGEIYLAVICPFLNWLICGVFVTKL